MLVEQLRVQLDVTGLVDTVNVTKGGSNAEVRADSRESGVDIEDILGLGVKLGVVDASVIDTILLTTGDTDFHLEPEAERCHALEVLYAGLDVLLLRLLGEIQHVGREQRLAVLLEVLLIGLQHAVEPWKKLVGTVVGVEDNGAKTANVSDEDLKYRIDVTYTPYAFATVRIWWAAAMAPRIDAC